MVSAFLIYAGLTKLAIVAAGTAAMILGYKLLRSGDAYAGTDLKASVEGRTGKAALSITNTTSGVVLVFFGFATIGLMIFRSPPMLDQQIVAEDGTGMSVLLRGDDRWTDSIAGMIRRGQGIARSTEGVGSSESIQYYREALGSLGYAANEIAWSYLQNEHLDDALAVAELAVALNPEDPYARDTLAEVLEKLGRDGEARHHRSRGAGITPESR